MNIAQKLRELAGDVRRAKSPAQAQAAWELAGRLLARSGVAAAEVERLRREADVAGLETLIAHLEGGPIPAPATATRDVGAAAAAPSAVSEEAKASALRAFRKRLKLARLADESKLGGRQLSGGKKSGIDAILPPHEFPAEVWEALARDGKLKDTGQGFYALR